MLPPFLRKRFVVSILEFLQEPLVLGSVPMMFILYFEDVIHLVHNIVATYTTTLRSLSPLALLSCLSDAWKLGDGQTCLRTLRT
jgi:hypothetical protein